MSTAPNIEQTPNYEIALANLKSLFEDQIQLSMKEDYHNLLQVLDIVFNQYKSRADEYSQNGSISSDISHETDPLLSSVQNDLEELSTHRNTREYHDLVDFKIVEIYIYELLLGYVANDHTTKLPDVVSDIKKALFAQYDTHSYGIIHLTQLNTIFVQLGIYLTQGEIGLVQRKYSIKPTHPSYQLFVSHSDINKSHIDQYIDYNLFLLYLEALHASSDTITLHTAAKELPAIMAARALTYVALPPSNLTITPTSPSSLLGTVVSPIIVTSPTTHDVVSPSSSSPKHVQPTPPSILSATQSSEIKERVHAFGAAQPSVLGLYNQFKQRSRTTSSQSPSSSLSIESLLNLFPQFGLNVKELPGGSVAFAQYIKYFASQSPYDSLKSTEFARLLTEDPPSQSPAELAQHRGGSNNNNDNTHEWTFTTQDRTFLQAMRTLSSIDQSRLFRKLDSDHDGLVTLSSLIDELVEYGFKPERAHHQSFILFARQYSSRYQLTSPSSTSPSSSTPINPSTIYFTLADLGRFRESRSAIAPTPVTSPHQTTIDLTGKENDIYGSVIAIAQHLSQCDNNNTTEYSFPELLDLHTEPSMDQKTTIPQVLYNTLTAAGVILSLELSAHILWAMSHSPSSPLPPEPYTTVSQRRSVVIACLEQPSSNPFIAQYSAISPQNNLTVRDPSRFAQPNYIMGDEAQLMESFSTLNLAQRKGMKLRQSSIFDTDDYYANDITNNNKQTSTSPLSNDNNNNHDTQQISQPKKSGRRSYLLQSSLAFAQDGPASNDDFNVISEDSQEAKHHLVRPVSHMTSHLSIDWENDHGGKTPRKSRQGLYSGAERTFMLEESHKTPSKTPSKSAQLLTQRPKWDSHIVDNDGIDEIRPLPRRSGNNYGSKIAEIDLDGEEAQSSRRRSKPLAQSQALSGFERGDNYTPVKAVSGTSIRTYSDKQHSTPGYMKQIPDGQHDKSADHRRQYDILEAPGKILHLDEGFQTAATPYIIKQQSRYGNDGNKLPITGHKLSSFVNPTQVSKRRQNYDQGIYNIVAHTDSLGFVYSTTAQGQNAQHLALIASVDKAYLDPDPVTTTTIPSPAVAQQSQQPSSFDDNNSNNMSDLSSPSSHNDEHEPFVLPEIDLNDDVDAVVATPIEPVAKQETSSPSPSTPSTPQHSNDDDDNNNGISQPILDGINKRLSVIAGSLGKSKQVFTQWSQYTNKLTPVHLNAAANINGLVMNIEQARALLSLVSSDIEEGISYSSFVRLLGRGEDL